MEQHAVNSSNVLAPMLVGFRQEMGIDINSISTRQLFVYKLILKSDYCLFNPLYYVIWPHLVITTSATPRIMSRPISEKDRQ